MSSNWTDKFIQKIKDTLKKTLQEEKVTMAPSKKLKLEKHLQDLFENKLKDLNVEDIEKFQIN